jgi:hypothetical protein
MNRYRLGQVTGKVGPRIGRVWLWNIGRVPRRSANGMLDSVFYKLEGKKYRQLEIVFLVDCLHEFVHFSACGIWVLPELSRDRERVHFQ